MSCFIMAAITYCRLTYTKKADGTILGSAVLANVPLKRNRITEYTGPLFSSNGQTTVSLSTEWDTEYTATW